MLRLVTGMAAACVVGVCFGAGSVKSELEARYRQVTSAFQRKEISGIASLLLPDYKATGLDNGSVSREQVLAGFKQQMKAVHDVTWVRKIQSLSVSPPNAMVIVGGDLTAKLNGHGPKTLELIATTIDFWVRTPKGWMLRSSKLTSSKTLFDGKMANRT